MLLFIYLLSSTIVFASDLPGEELFVAPADEKVTTESKPTVVRQGIPNNNTPDSKSRNLPYEYTATLSRQSTASELVAPPKGSVELFRGIKVGESLRMKVTHSVIAFPDEKSPVVALSEIGALRGIRFIGESYLEKNTKRIFIDFNRVAIGDRIYNFKGVGVSSEGQPGLFGEHHSREAELFAGDFISSFVAGYFDGLVPRRTNAFGQIETDTSVDSAVKKGLASGALSSAERFREKLKKVPEFSEIRGPFEIMTLVLEQAKTTN